MNQSTFSQYAQAMRQAAVNSARSILCRTADAEDVASEVMITLWMMRERLQTKTCIAYAQVTARHKAINLHRDRDRCHDSIDDTDVARHLSSPTTPEDRMIAQEDIDWFFKRVEQLPSTQQEILRLRQVEMLDKAEIARRLGLPETSVSTLLSRARRTMYNAIKERMQR